jgi:hypothetical protein
MPASRAKEDRMWRLVDEFASSGKYSNWLEIEWELRSRGFSRARYLLDREVLRERLNCKCAKAQARLQNA